MADLACHIAPMLFWPMTSDTDYDDALIRWLQPDTQVAVDEPDLMAVRGGDPEAVARVRDWVRERFNLPAETAIMVSEVTCNLAGCPPLETVVAFWENETRYHFKLFKPVSEVTSDNLPFAWMKDSLIVPEGFGCECC